MRCETVNLAEGDVTGLPSDFDYVLNLAVAKSGKWDRDLAANADAVGVLMAHCRGAQAFLHCSSAAVYDPPNDDVRTEDAALGDNHKPLFPTYSISKIAGEAVARSMSRVLGVPTTIARLNVPYGGGNGGWMYYHMEMMLAGIPFRCRPADRPATTRSTRTTSSPPSPNCLTRRRFRRRRSIGPATRSSASSSGALTSAH